MKRILKAIKKTLVLFANKSLVHTCISCGKEIKDRGKLCDSCYEHYLEERRHGCVYCHMPAPECVCSTRELKYCRTFCKSLHSMMFYDLELKTFSNIIFKLKTYYNRSVEVFFADELACELRRLAQINGTDLKDWYITYPPRSKKRKNEFGFDHSEGLARRIAEINGMTFQKAFKRNTSKGSGVQKKLNRENRKLNAEKALTLVKKADPKNKYYIIVDDIITSGSTMKQCQNLLLKNGAKAAFPISIAKTYSKGSGVDAPVQKNKKPDTAWFMD